MNWKKLVLNARAKYRCFISAKNQILTEKDEIEVIGNKTQW